ncbi:unnamed protein product [Brachionus calyciflorus]|uniref:Uncharacterized protein n=1 Tax=Brachionus calyciflorus TaxID=104777 RepID=A0A813PE18_9BILA|nr:unnamed protein product [Brachionus calyciflorus]
MDQKIINESNGRSTRNSIHHRLSNVLEDIDSEGLMGTSDKQMNTNLDEDCENLDQKTKSNQISSSKSNQNISNFTSTNSITNGQRVKFSSDYNLKYNEQLEPLIQGTNENSRFKITQVKDSKKLLEKTADDDESKYFIDEKGSIIRKTNSNLNEVKKPRKSLTERDGDVDSKAIQFKYNKDAKSLEVSINIGNSSSKENGCFTQLKCFSFYQALFAEFLGTFLLVLFVCGFGLPIADPNIIPPGINGCLGSGLIVASLVWGLGHIGGANLNPAVSLALLITGQTNLIRAIFYIAFQLLGAVLGALTLVELVPEHLYQAVASNNLVSNSSELRSKRELNSTEKFLPSDKSVVVYPIEYSNIGVTSISDQISPIQGFFVEVIITFILVFCIFSSIDKRRKDLGGSFPLTIGFAVTVGALFGGNFTGGSMNPARSFGPAFVTQNWTHHWIYWAGPITGAIIAGVLYKLLVIKKRYLIKK